jgi:hypothetical protein
MHFVSEIINLPHQERYGEPHPLGALSAHGNNWQRAHCLERFAAAQNSFSNKQLTFLARRLQ